MEIGLDSNLPLITDGFAFFFKATGHDQLLEIIKSTNGEIAGKLTQPPYESLIPKTADFYHQNMASYLETCWNTHAGVVMRPDMFYFTVLSEIAKYVIANAEACRHLFTTEQEKQDIVIVQDTDKCIEFDRLVEALKSKIPSKVDGLLPLFSTDTAMSKEARLASFAEAVSPYYRYSTTRCGISKIRLEGTEADWASICDALKAWIELLPDKEMKEVYLARMLEIGEQILADLRSKKMTEPFWQQMYFQINCASGGPFVHGWLLDLYHIHQKASRNKLMGHISRVKWTVLETGQKYVVHHGLFSSKLDTKTSYLIPEFSRIIFNRPTDDAD